MDKDFENEIDIQLKYKCPFCNNSLISRFSKCFNIYCNGKEFNEDNLVLYRLNPNFGIGKIVKKIKIPTSKSFDEEDLSFIVKFKVKFKNNLSKIIHPIDLIHYIFRINEEIKFKNQNGIINSSEILIKDGKLSYEVLLPNGKTSQIYESEIILKPLSNLKNQLIEKDIDPPKNFLIRYWANLFNSYYKSHHIKCITNSRLTLMPHQINVAHRLSEEFFPRVILADEVGLGKTIEAGIYMKEMIARNLVERILIIVPATLVKQWQFEMKNKFNIDFIIYDGKRYKNLKKKGTNKYSNQLENPFYYDNLIICSLQFARNPKYRDLLSQISWDVVIFDEAHHLRRYSTNITTCNYRETMNFSLAKKLSENCESLLLLTATPLQLHSFELFSLIELIHPELFRNFSDFEHFRKNIPFINLLASNINQIDKLNTFELKNTIKLLKEFGYINENQSNKEIIQYIKNSDAKSLLIGNLEKDHTLSKFLIRNRKKNIFPKDLLNERIVKTIMLHPTKEELDIYNEIRLYLAKIYNSAMSNKNPGIGFVITTLQKLLTSSKYAILNSLERRLKQINNLKNISEEFKHIKYDDPEFFQSELEEEYLDIESKIDILKPKSARTNKNFMNVLNQENILREFHSKLVAIPYDSKSDKFLEIINQIYKNNPEEKILVFTQFVDTLLYLKDLLMKNHNLYTIETFYGGLNKIEKYEAVERFRNSEKLSILLSTEIGGEGRNFQFCRVLINYDLPWNPMKLEQRIGRLDRIGQKSRKLYIYNLFMEGTIEADILFALNKRINLFEESIGYLEPIIGSIEKDFKDLIFSEPEQKQRKLREFNFDLENQLKNLTEIEMQLDDFIIDKKSFQMKDLISFISSCEDVKLSHNELFLLINLFFNLNSNKFGYIQNLNSTIKNNENPINYESKIVLKEVLQNHSYQKLLEEYYGTFDLEIAKNKEEIDFFALGHPLINSIIEFCIGETFSGSFSILTLNKDVINKNNTIIDDNNDILFLFVFNNSFHGYIIENVITAIIVDERGIELKNLEEIILDIKDYDILYNFNNQNIRFPNIGKNRIIDLRQKARNLVKKKNLNWKNEITTLNDKIFNLDINKKEKLYHYKKKVLEKKKNILNIKLKRKIDNLPNEKQLNRINSLKDEKQRQKRLNQIQELEEQIRFMKNIIIKLDKKLDNLSFFYTDLKNDMIKKNQGKLNTKLIAFALLNFK